MMQYNSSALQHFPFILILELCADVVTLLEHDILSIWSIQSAAGWRSIANLVISLFEVHLQYVHVRSIVCNCV